MAERGSQTHDIFILLLICLLVGGASALGIWAELNTIHKAHLTGCFPGNPYAIGKAAAHPPVCITEGASFTHEFVMSYILIAILSAGALLALTLPVLCIFTELLTVLLSIITRLANLFSWARDITGGKDKHMSQKKLPLPPLEQQRQLLRRRYRKKRRKSS
ncbi:hypothetical protein BV494_24680 (plasmid) [Rahnella sikkimica]|uniref:Uncharacterized protein n=1 Tax=Rahnella sikkimica TaxID=1805933 RepID=A0A2L1UYU6_9GAMM|nr:hypothetical protein BV494_24680 [Rahnella sikkimica]